MTKQKVKSKEELLTKQVYSKQAEREWNRLAGDAFHQIEFETTFRFLNIYLPKKGIILDAGGGPGRYTIELAKRGYSIILLDLVKENLELAKRKIREAKVDDKVRNIIEGNIVNLSKFNDNTFDAVICLGGPLSHVAPEKNRLRAISELIRVSKKNAPIFISVMGRFGALMQFPRRWPNEIIPTTHFKQYVFNGEDYMWVGKHYCHFFTLEEFLRLFIDKRITILKKVGLEGLSTVDSESINKLHNDSPKAWKNWMDAHYKLCTYDTIVDISAHMMVICRKK